MQANLIDLPTILNRAIKALPHLHKTVQGLFMLARYKPEQLNSIGLQLEKLTARHPNKTALLYQDQEISYGEFNRQVNRLAHYLESRGIGCGDVVAIMAENRPETLYAIVASLKLGAIASMINTTQRGEILVHSLELVRSKLCIVGEELIDAVLEVREQLSEPLQQGLLFYAEKGTIPCPDICTDLEVEVSNCPDTNPSSTTEVRLGQPCFYIFTSGTTGLPKASIMTHQRWFKAMAGIGIASLRIKADDVFYVPLPFYHNNALTLAFSAVMGAGATLAISRKFSVSRFWDEVRQYNATCFAYIGELLRYLMSAPPQAKDKTHRIRIIIGNGLRPDIWETFEERFAIPHINEFYGASECNLVFTNAFNITNSAGYCPLSFDVVQYDIEQDEPVRNKLGFIVPVNPGESGLLITKLTNAAPFEGYTDGSANKKKLLSNVFNAGDSYFNSGDLVLKQGYRHIAFVDRLGDTFRWKGENVATTEVEAITNEFSAVEQSVVYGVQIPNADGRAGMAALTLKDSIEEFDLQAFTKLLKQKLPAYAVPLFLRIKTQHEITGTFKVRKVELKNEAYHLAQVNEPVYVLLPKSDCYQPLDSELEGQIDSGVFSF